MIFTCCRQRPLYCWKANHTKHHTLQQTIIFLWSSLIFVIQQTFETVATRSFTATLLRFSQDSDMLTKFVKKQLCKIEDLDLNGQTVLNWASNAVADSELKSNRYRRRALIKKEFDIRVPWKIGNCFSNCETISFSRLFCSMELAAWKVGGLGRRSEHLSTCNLFLFG